MDKMSWSLSGVWNESLILREERKLEKRDYIWASELGGSFMDRWLKMNAEIPSNPFDPRSLRKFEAGNFFEWIVEFVLRRAGILIDKQEHIEHQYSGLPKVTGRLDYLAGGKPDYEKAIASLKADNVPPVFLKIGESVTKYFVEKYPTELKPVVLEVKSVGSMKFHRYQTYGIAEPNHQLQLFHYLKGKNLPEGHIIYISKDDLCLAECGVFNTSIFEQKYMTDIRKMGEYLKSGQPPKEKEIIFDDVENRFSANWKIGYSSYLTKVYGYKNLAEFNDKIKPMVERWNRVLGRVAAQKEMTDNNKEAIEEMTKSFPNAESILKQVKEKGMEEEAESEAV